MHLQQALLPAGEEIERLESVRARCLRASDLDPREARVVVTMTQLTHLAAQLDPSHSVGLIIQEEAQGTSKVITICSLLQATSADWNVMLQPRPSNSKACRACAATCDGKKTRKQQTANGAAKKPLQHQEPSMPEAGLPVGSQPENAACE